MSAFLVVHITIKDPEKWKSYTENAPATVAANGGEFLAMGKKAGVIHGEHDGDLAAIIQFPDQAAVNTWYGSPEYQALIPNRDEAADMTFISYNRPPA